MALLVLQAPATMLLSTLDRTKAELGITDTSSDDTLYDILVRASSAITRECGRPFFGLAQYKETLPGSNSPLLGLSCVPVLAVSTVLEDDATVDPTDATDGYSIEDPEAGVLYREAGWTSGARRIAWGYDAYSSRYILPGAQAALRYTVTYWAGYLLPPQVDYLPYNPTEGSGGTGTASQRADPPPLPGAIEQACLETVKAWYLSRTRDVAVAKITTADQSITYADAAAGAEQVRALPTVALGLLRNYRRVA